MYRSTVANDDRLRMGVTVDLRNEDTNTLDNDDDDDDRSANDPSLQSVAMKIIGLTARKFGQRNDGVKKSSFVG